MNYLLTIFLFTGNMNSYSGDMDSLYEVTTLEVKNIEECVKTGYNVVDLYKELGKQAKFKCNPL